MFFTERPGGPGQLPAQGSHRSGRAHISASGSSTDRFAIRKTVPEAIQSSYGDMLRNLDVFRMFPSIESAGRRLAFLYRVLQGEFPCFNGTIKALRLPAARLAVLRCLRLAIPREHSAAFVSPAATECQAAGLGLVTRYPHPGFLPWRRQDLPSSWGTQLSVCTCSSTPAGLLAPDH